MATIYQHVCSNIRELSLLAGSRILVVEVTGADLHDKVQSMDPGPSSWTYP